MINISSNNTINAGRQEQSEAALLSAGSGYGESYVRKKVIIMIVETQ